MSLNATQPNVGVDVGVLACRYISQKGNLTIVIIDATKPHVGVVVGLCVGTHSDRAPLYLHIHIDINHHTQTCN